VTFVTASALASACDSTEPRGPGAISVSAVATATDAFFEYGIAIDGGTPRRVFVGQSVFFTQTGLAHGGHTVSIIDTPPACTGTATKSVTVRGNDTVPVVFTIGCPRTTGDLHITVATTGNDIDQNGYFLTINGQIVDQVPANSIADFSFIPPGSYTVALSDVAGNCTTPAPQVANIAVGQVTNINFSITCTPVGVFRFVTSVTGADRDPDGALVQVDGNATPIAFTGATNVRVQTGSRSYSIADVQPNCTVTGPTTGTHTFAAGDTVTVTLDVSCSAIALGTAGSAGTDAAGDTLPNPGNNANPAHDVLTVRGRYATGFLIMVMKFARAVTPITPQNLGGLVGYVEFDLDESTATGQSAFINEFGGNATQGVDFAVLLHQMDSVSMTAVRVGNDNAAVAGRVRARFDGDSIIVFLPLNKLNDDGKLTVTATIGTNDRPTDLAPNTGQTLLQATGPIVAARAGGSGASQRMPALSSDWIDYRKAGNWKRKP
jgi:hypothetical protein